MLGKIETKKKFVVFCFPRTGSYYFGDIINQQMGVTCHGELFKPNRVELEKKYSSLTNFKPNDVDKRDEDPLGFYHKVCAQSEGDYVGFKLFPSHNQTILQYLMYNLEVHKIFLARNPIQSLISLLMANKSGKWTKVSDKPDGSEAQVVEVKDIQLINHCLHQKVFYERLKMVCALTKQPFFIIDYNDIHNEKVLENLSAYLQLDSWSMKVTTKYKKQINRSYPQVVKNYEVIEAFCEKFSVNTKMNYFEFVKILGENIYHL